MKPAAKRAEVELVNFQVIRRTFATLIQMHGTIQDAQRQLWHTTANLTLETHMQAIPERLRKAVNSL